MSQCPGCGHGFESPDADPFCSSCVESGTRDAYQKGFAAAMKQVERAFFKVGDIVVSKPTRTGCTVRDVVWVPRYGLETYNGYRSVLSQGQARLELEPQHEPVVGSMWYPPELDEEWKVFAVILGDGGRIASVQFEQSETWFEVGRVKLNFCWVRDP